MTVDMRKLLDILTESEGEYIPPPPEYEDKDDPHRDALAQTGYWGKRAAGCLLFARDTRKFLLMFRSLGVLQPHTWGLCGGAADEDESDARTAEREGREETGCSQPIAIKPMYIYRDGSFQYSNFLGVIEHEFVPDLGWEAEGYEWCEFGHWPDPLHFGVKALFGDEASIETMKAAVADAQKDRPE